MTNHGGNGPIAGPNSGGESLRTAAMSAADNAVWMGPWLYARQQVSHGPIDIARASLVWDPASQRPGDEMDILAGTGRRG